MTSDVDFGPSVRANIPGSPPNHAPHPGPEAVQSIRTHVPTPTSCPVGLLDLQHANQAAEEAPKSARMVSLAMTTAAVLKPADLPTFWPWSRQSHSRAMRYLNLACS